MHVHSSVQNASDANAPFPLHVEDDVSLELMTSHPRRNPIGPTAKHRVLREKLEA